MARDHRELVEMGLRLKKIGDRIVSLIGGREIHPVSACVGGFYRVPGEWELRELSEDLKWALEASVKTARVVASFDFSDFEQDYEFVSLCHPEEYPLNEGHLVSNKGLDIDVAEYADHFIEQHIKHSNALHSMLRGRGSYLVGPLARYNLNFARLPEVARQVSRDCGLTVPCRNPFKSIVVRSVEMVFACAEAMRIIEAYARPESPRVEVPVHAGVGSAATEAPRGILYHRYSIDDRGLIRFAKIVPPTPQNQKCIEEDLLHFASRPTDEVTWKCEQAVRNYDPCISCATHFLRLEVERE